MVLSGDTNGAVTVTVPAVAGTNTITLPAATGTAVLTNVSSNVDINAANANYLTLSTNTTERMRIDSSGNLLVGTTSILAAPSKVQVVGGGGGGGQGPLALKNPNNAAIWYTGPDNAGNYCVVNTSIVGVYMPSGATSWSSGSDERLKADLKPIENAVDKVSTLRSVTGRYKTDEEGTSRSFLIAQDVQKVLPEAVNEFEGYLGVQYTDVIPLLVASIKELNAKVTALEEQVINLGVK
jgi:hypothetical protein